MVTDGREKRNEMIYDWVLGKLVLYIYSQRKSKGFERERSKDNFGWREMRRVKVSLNSYIYIYI